MGPRLRRGLVFAHRRIVLHALALGLALGVTSAVHCIAMCGPLTAFVALDADGATDPWRVVRYQLGRFVGYGTLGALLGGLGGTLAGISPPHADAFLSIALGLSLALAAYQLWPRSASPAAGLVSVTRAPRGPTFRERISRASASLLSVTRRAPFALGLATALLPCGVLGAAALLAASTGHALTGAAAMIGVATASALGIGTVGLALGRVRTGRSATLARVMAITLAIGAVVLFVRPTLFVSDVAGSCHPH